MTDKQLRNLKAIALDFESLRKELEALSYEQARELKIVAANLQHSADLLLEVVNRLQSKKVKLATN